jgi:hypothetical protein
VWFNTLNAIWRQLNIASTFLKQYRRKNYDSVSLTKSPPLQTWNVPCGVMRTFTRPFSSNGITGKDVGSGERFRRGEFFLGGGWLATC